MGWFKKDFDLGTQAAEIQQYDSMDGFANFSKNPLNNMCLIKMAEFNSMNNLDEIDNIKENLADGNIIILNANALLENHKDKLLEIKRAIELLRSFCREIGGSIGRIGDNFLIMTPNPYIRIGR